MKKLLPLFALLVALPALAQPSAPHMHYEIRLAKPFTPQILIKNGRLLTMGPAGTITGDVLIKDGKIAAIGKTLAAPPAARVIDAKGKPVTPGLMASWTQLGIVEVEMVNEANDSRPNLAQNGAAFDVADALNPDSMLIPIARIAGVTRSLTTPALCDGVFCGTAAAIQLGHGDPLVKRRAGVLARLEPFAGNTRPDLWSRFRETLDDAREYWAARAGYRRPGGFRDQRSTRVDLEALGPVIRGEEPLLVYAMRADSIRMAVQYAVEHKLKLVILGGDEAWKVAGQLAAAHIPVVIDANMNLPASFSALHATLRNAAILDAVGVTVIFQPQNDDPAHYARTITQIAGNAVANGMAWDHALAAITRNPAEVFGIGKQYGTLEVGKDADVVVWDGDPLEVTSAPVAVVIQGAVMPMTSRQTMLRDRYRTLDGNNGYR